MELNNSQQDKNSYNTPIQDMVENTKKDSTVGPLIGSIIIILIIAIGGLYFWGSLILDKKKEIQTQEVMEEQQDNETELLLKQSSSDDTASIEADLEAMTIDSVDDDFSSIESEY